MSKKNQSVDPVTGIDELNENLTSVTEKVQNNQKVIVWCSVAIAAIVAVILIYIYLVHGPSVSKANDEIGKADVQLALGNDSVALAQYMNVADNNGHDAGNRAALQSAVMLYQKGEYEKALTYLDKFSPSESVIGAAACSLKGDCYVNLDNLDKAVPAYKDAISESDNSPLYTPFFMMKLARVYRAQKNYSAEADIYRQVLDDYPEYGNAYGIDVEKYLKRAQLESGAK